MLYLLRSTINPDLSLQKCLQTWPRISQQLREPPRRRTMQVERLIENNPLLS